jgi:hypothetical protein
LKTLLDDQLTFFHAGLDEFVEDPEENDYDCHRFKSFYSKTTNRKRTTRLARFQEAMPLRI